MAAAGRDVADGCAVPLSTDRKIVGTNSKSPGVKSTTKSFGEINLNEHVCNHGRKNKAEVERPPPELERPQPRPARSRPARLEDVFQDEIAPRFVKMTDFKKFARSQKGLRLKDYDIENVLEDCRGAEEQRMQMLSLWRQKLGKNATPEKIRGLVDAFFTEEEDSGEIEI